jgi:hypothetical protein
MRSTIPILSMLACLCLIAVIARLRSRERTRESVRRTLLPRLCGPIGFDERA